MTARCLHTMDAFHQTAILFFCRDNREREKMFLRHLIPQQVESRVVVVVLFLRCRANPLLCLLHTHPQRHNPPTPCSADDKSSPCVANAAALRGPLRAVGAPSCTSQTSHFSSVTENLLVFTHISDGFEFVFPPGENVVWREKCCRRRIHCCSSSFQKITSHRAADFSPR